MANVTFTPEAWDQASNLPKKIRARLVSIVDRLARWPEVSGAKPLKGYLAGYYRMRTGDYRVQFCVEVTDVVIVKVGHRDRFYEE